MKKYYNKLYFSFSIITVLIIGMFIYSNKIITNTNFLVKKLKEDRQSIEFLSKEFKNKNVFIDSPTYIISKASGLNIVTEHETVVFFNDIH